MSYRGTPSAHIAEKNTGQNTVFKMRAAIVSADA